jgi:hypothetical protein
MKKKRGPLKQGFWFGSGFMIAAYLVMFLIDGISELAATLFVIIMTGLGFSPGI